MNEHINPIFKQLFDDLIPDISRLPIERATIDFDALGVVPDDFGGEAA